MGQQGSIFPANLLSTFFALLIISLSCSKQKAELVIDSGAVTYDDSTVEYPHLIFADGQISQNDCCMVSLKKLNRKMPPLYVNGHPVGFC